MAVVYKAFDTRLERNVAIKVILPGKEHSEKFLKRFEREAKALAQLSHPNIVKVIDYGEQDGMPYLVMEYLPGGTLKQKLAGKPMSCPDAVKILIPIARALGYAHEQKIIHRDVKSSNILVTQSGEPMLSDFGIAKLLEAEETMDLTGTGVGVGTPEYMSPEQAQGKAVDARSDIYSLGVIFYEMVTGRKPYQADTPMAVVWKLASEPLPRPRQFQPNLPDQVEEVLIKALARNPENRFQTMHDFGQVLDQLGMARKVTPLTWSKSRLLIRAGQLITLATVAFIWWRIAGGAPIPGFSRSAIENTPMAVSASEVIPTGTNSLTAVYPPLTNGIPVAIVSETERVYYDQFENSAYEGSINGSLWNTKSSNCKISQLNGTLQFVNRAVSSHQECDVYSRKSGIFPGSNLGVFEVQEFIASDYNEQSVVTQEIQFRTDSLSGGTWFAICGLIAEGKGNVTGFMNVSFYGGGSEDYQDYYGTVDLDSGYDTWHTVRLESDSESFQITCQVDGQVIGTVVPRDADLLKTADFSRGLEAARGPGAKATSYVDNIFFEPSAVATWEFNDDGDSEDWALADWQYINVTAPTVKNGLLSVETTGNDPQIYTHEGMRIDAQAAKTLWIRMRISGGAGPAELFFNTLERNDWSEDRAKPFAIQTGGEFKTYVVDLDSHSGWQGTIIQLRLDPVSDYVGAIIEIDYIRLYP